MWRKTVWRRKRKEQTGSATRRRTTNPSVEITKSEKKSKKKKIIIKETVENANYRPDYESNVISVLQAARRQTRYRRSWPDTFRGVFRARSCRRRLRRLSSSVVITRRERGKRRGPLAMRCRGMSARKRGGNAWRITRITRTTLRASRTVRGAGPDSISSPVNPSTSLIFRLPRRSTCLDLLSFARACFVDHQTSRCNGFLLMEGNWKKFCRHLSCLDISINLIQSFFF